MQHDASAKLKSTPAATATDNRRDVATNTQLTMQRSSVGLQGSLPQPSGGVPGNSPHALPTLSAASSSANLQFPPSGIDYMQAGIGQPLAGSSNMQSGYAQDRLEGGHVQSMTHSDSVGSLSSLPSMEGVERRISGQVPMRAGSPALGSRVSSRRPAWSAQKHDPFGELVGQDIRSSSSRSIDTSNVQGPP